MITPLAKMTELEEKTSEILAIIIACVVIGVMLAWFIFLVIDNIKTKRAKEEWLMCQYHQTKSIIHNYNAITWHKKRSKK